MVIGYIVMLVGGIMILIAAFKQSVAWGLCSLLIPFVAIVFVIKYWAEAKRGFFIWLIGLPIAIIGGVLAGFGAASAASQGAQLTEPPAIVVNA